MIHCPNVVLALVHRRRRWPNVKSASGSYLVCAGVIWGYNAGLTLAHRPRRLPIVKPALCSHLMFSGLIWAIGECRGFSSVRATACKPDKARTMVV